MTITEANAVNTILKWAANPAHTTPNTWRKTEEAGMLLAASANKTLKSGFTAVSFARAFKRRQADFIDVKTGETPAASKPKTQTPRARVAKPAAAAVNKSETA